MVCALLMLPSESYLIQLSTEADVDAIHQARQFVRLSLSKHLSDELRNVYQQNQAGASDLDLSYLGMSQRSLKNTALALLSLEATESFFELARNQFKQANNMTDSFAALSALVNSGNKKEADKALSTFHQQWRDDAQVIEQWLSVQAASASFTDLSSLKKLMTLPDFELSNPNKVRAVIGVYCNQNLVHFHDVSGEGYAFLADNVIKLDDMNPQIASRLLTPLTRWKKFNSGRQAMMVGQLKRIHAKESLSKDVREVLEKSLS